MQSVQPDVLPGGASGQAAPVAPPQVRPAHVLSPLRNWVNGKEHAQTCLKAY